MPATQLRKEVRPFCHEHHVEMRLTQRHLDSKDATTQAPTYACSEPDCPVNYSVLRGYFVPGQKGNANKQDAVPSVRCLHDGTPMYLAGLDPGKPSFRLWICPHCDGRRTNEESLIGSGREEIQNGAGEIRVEPNP
jgi:hypothetical protein